MSGDEFITTDLRNQLKSRSRVERRDCPPHCRHRFRPRENDSCEEAERIIGVTQSCDEQGLCSRARG